MRKRINKNLICSTEDYHRTHSAYLFFLKEFHEKNKEEIEAISNRILAERNNTTVSIEENISIGKRPYTKVFGKLQELTISDAIRMNKTINIIWR